MPANLLILPYIAGFWFISRCYLAKYRAQRHDGYRLLFYSAIAGLAFLMVPLFLEYVLFFFGLLPAGKHLEYFFPFLSSFGIQGIGTALTATILGIASAEVINKVEDKRHRQMHHLMKAIDRGENEFEKLIKDSWHASGEGDKIVLLSFTLKSREVYIGIPLELPVPFKSSHISLLPLFGGYCDQDTMEFAVTDDYWAFYKRVGEISDDGEPDTAFSPEQYRLVLAKDSIDTVKVFDFAYYDFKESQLQEDEQDP
ncbi:hypothetical protein INT08_09685 [Prosthecochloris sp. N3]|uniref:Uncharacterized protein n=1 Tax=Prosthecochloris ethylica TaxID=2743976 RepID=A0ABR9XUM4_9CHLB|nr:hypothetical protein [Prosthecochloris ethylica]MBF0587300.1 hypothetical protein [Prosthecochloris ethylica]MBF0637436.1 hypothetical protein [Prosthecochloris ethylica]NUK48583.1 hypothetical protein [Prosthecochloris ethylica]